MKLMNLQQLLQEIPCACGKVHRCAIAHIVVESGAMDKLHQFVQPYGHILLVADTKTYAVCGERVKSQLGGHLETVLVLRRDGLLVPDERAIGEVNASMTPQTDLIVGVGSGVIQDLCKYVSFQRGLPYQIVATAPSMDGYASIGAAMILGNQKVTISAHVPQVILGDVDILKDAPMDMIRSGYGDILGKYSCLNDWKLSHLINGEYFCQFVYDLMMDMVKKTRPLGNRLQQREPEAIKILMEALCGAGAAMAMVGNSRPASGSEHHLSHFFEITGIVFRQPYLMHGTDVAFSAVYTQRLREKLIRLPHLPPKRAFDRESWTASIRRVYGSAAEGVIELQDRLGWYRQDRYPIYREKWAQIRDLLSDAPSSEELLGCVRSVGLRIEDFEKLYGKEKLEDALHYAKDLKDRYSVLWLWNDLLIEEP